ncbi:MAG: hypothetical protein E6Q25_05925 [Acinetobacter sp.]|jgi:hypothetical protein|nr:MAG: hypothetical protein E6Q25_05925 [Acinetobacter sp.]
MKFFFFAAIMLAAVVQPYAAEFAVTQTMTMKTPDGQTIRIGDTEASLLKKMPQSSKPRQYMLNNGKLNCGATEYTYRIKTQEYKVTLCLSESRRINQVVRIVWRNLDAKELLHTIKK